MKEELKITFQQKLNCAYSYDNESRYDEEQENHYLMCEIDHRPCIGCPMCLNESDLFSQIMRG